MLRTVPTRQHARPTQSARLKLPGARLVVIKGPDKGRALTLDKDELSVGSGAPVDLRLSDAAVSRAHFSLRVTETGVLLTDLESTNGTFVDDRRVRAVYLRPGDRIELGKSCLRLEAARAGVDVPLSDAHQFGALIGQSVAARRLFATLEQLAPTEMTVLLLGETGTGKEVTARALHDACARVATDGGRRLRLAAGRAHRVGAVRPRARRVHRRRPCVARRVSLRRRRHAVPRRDR